MSAASRQSGIVLPMVLVLLTTLSPLLDALIQRLEREPPALRGEQLRLERLARLEGEMDIAWRRLGESDAGYGRWQRVDGSGQTAVAVVPLGPERRCEGLERPRCREIEISIEYRDEDGLSSRLVRGGMVVESPDTGRSLLPGYWVLQR
ncbi:hypothetical protein [Halotalea alkalilenta]|uniref:Uncharacterized protein n=1 Tax=Halotalea alkalilenta TaxID=376489 RepID=A0A172YJF5_9GAMM|nr:hypothetical protein [Halotalea alkalilenta]ANF59306.1 hypothetical protein A5892_19125 [Halotalea alkalilenta]